MQRAMRFCGLLLAGLGAVAPVCAQGPDKPGERKIDKPSDVPQGQPSDRPADGAARQAEVKQLVRDVETHEVRLARLQRLRTVFGERGATDKVAKIDRLIEQENARHGKVLGAHRDRLGDDAVAQLERRMQARRDRAGSNKSDKSSDVKKNDKPGDAKKSDQPGEAKKSDRPRDGKGGAP